MGFDASTPSNLLTSSPGDLIYHLVIGFALLLTLTYAILSLRKAENAASAKHLLIGTSILLFVQLVLFSLSTTFSLEIFAVSPTFAMIERIAAGLSVVWLVWLFFEQDPRFIWTGSSVFLTIGMLFFGTTLIVLNNLDLAIMPDMNQLHLVFWQSGVLFLILASLVILYLKRPRQWLIAAVMLLLQGAAHLYHIIQFTPGSLGLEAVRWAQTLSLPWILCLLLRLPVPAIKIPGFQQQSAKTSERVDITPFLVNDLLKISLLENKPEKIKAIVKAVSLAARSDICFLLQIADQQQDIHFLTGYDLIRETFIESAHVSQHDLSLILESWKVNQFLKLSDHDSDTRVFTTLTKILGYHRIGYLLAYPLNLPEQQLNGGVIFLSPYTDKHFGETTITLMDETRQTLARVLFEAKPQQIPQTFDVDLKSEVLALQEEKEKLTQTLLENESMLAKLEGQLKGWKAKYQIEKFDSVQHIERLKDELTHLNTQLAEQPDKSDQLEQLQSKIRQLIAERDQLQTALSRANAQIEDLKLQVGQTGPIRLSMDNQVISLDSIATNAKIELAAAIQQKDIELEIVNPEAAAMIKTDPGLLQTILFHLLDNAIKASDSGRPVQLIQKLSYETGMLIIQVTDYGKGLTPSEQSALFGPEPREVPGIGSLASIREAVRAIRVMNGKVWLKSEKGTFTTFRAQVPVRIID